MEKKKIIIIILQVILLVLGFYTLFKPATNKTNNRINELYPISFHGVVTALDLGRGFIIGLDHMPNIYDLSGTCNDTSCLSFTIKFGDSIWKASKSNIIYLKSKHTKLESRWLLPK